MKLQQPHNKQGEKLQQDYRKHWYALQQPHSKQGEKFTTILP